MANTPNAEPLITEECVNNVCWLTLNRPKQRNTLSRNMISALTDAINRAGEDPMVRVVVIRALGPVFSAGHDLREMSALENEDLASTQNRMREILKKCETLMMTIMHSPRAIIACVQGTATAAGCQLVSACDLAVASTSASFCTPGVNLGGFCTTPLVGIGRNLSRKHAMAMALTGDNMSAEDAVRVGLVNDAVEPSELVNHTRKLAEHIASKSAQGIRQGKADFYRQVEMPLVQAFNYANEAMVRTMTNPDSQEGSAAFFEKRDPQWGDA
jgi:enoyl-CoA hydratase/carnithine racemase